MTIPSRADNLPKKVASACAYSAGLRVNEAYLLEWDGNDFRMQRIAEIDGTETILMTFQRGKRSKKKSG